MNWKALAGMAGFLVVAVGVFFGVQFFLLDNAEISQEAGAGVEQLEAETEGDRVFRIDSAQSTAEFNIDEVLRREEVTVVGTTNELAGDIRVNVANPAASEVSEIRINARALETDESGRNRALRNFILQSSDDQYEFITFQPTSLENMPESVSVGESFEFQIVGDLTIVDTTQEVTFDVTVTPTAETEIEGVAETTVLYPDFGITIPSVPFVASVEEDVLLRLDFVATEAADTDTTEADDETTES